MRDDPEPDLGAQLLGLRAERARSVRAEWDRSLPFADLVFDRWERAAEMGFGDGSSCYDSVVVLGDVRVGRNVWIGPNVILDGSGGSLTIGDGCDISASVHVYTHDTVLRCVSGGALPAAGGSVSIGSNCYIGPLSVIAKGVTIGDRSVVGANSFVRADIEARSVVGGSPAVRIGSVVGDGASTHIEHHRREG